MDNNSELENELIKKIVPSKLPVHIAIIMDGNGRWARERGFRDRTKGHEYATTAVRETVRVCNDISIKYLSHFAFSTENWKRPKREVNTLMYLLNKYLKLELKEMLDNNIKLVASGRLDDLPINVRKTLNDVMQKTEKNNGLVLNFCLSYSGRSEIIDAIKKILASNTKNKIDLSKVEENFFRQYLYKPEIPDPDLLIRTSGEVRVSNFFLWQLAYTEIYVTDVLWPDFRKKDLLEAIIDYQKRERRFGKIN